MTMRTVGRAVAVTAGAVALIATGSGVAQAASKVQIYRVYYNSPGSDNRSNASLNAEYVVLKNTDSAKHSIKGWTLRDRSGHVYTFPSFTLGAKKYVTVHTGRGTNTSANLYWGSRAYIWNNTGDTAYLRWPGGTLADSCRWGSSGSSKYC
ncbi:MAG TPA: lamin tail domain-containing protein [Streptosporangiaceae bacterium]